MTKELFIKSMEHLKACMEWEEKLYELGVNFWEREEYALLIDSYINMLEYTCHDVKADKYAPTDISYFIYDCEWGTKSDEYYILSDDDSKEYHLHTIEDLWNYLVEIHPEIEDKTEIKEN